MIARATDEYKAAEPHAAYTGMRYYVDDDIAAIVLPKGYTRANLSRLNPSKFADCLCAAVPMIEQKYGRADPSAEERASYVNCINHAHQRLHMIEQPPTTTTAP